MGVARPGDWLNQPRPWQAQRIAASLRNRRAAELTDDEASRRRVASRPRNLDFLLRRRNSFVNDALKPGQRVLEIGAGLGVTALYVDGVELVTSDYRPKPWVDTAADAQVLPFRSGAFDAAVAMHVLHHLPSPRSALHELIRVVRPGGLLIIAEPHESVATRVSLWLSRHEYIDHNIDPYESDRCQTRPEFAGGGNNCIGDLLFDDMPRFHATFPGLTLEHHEMAECLTFLNSGGVSARGPAIPLPPKGLALLGKADDRLMRFTKAFPLCRELVFRKASAPSVAK